MSMPRTTTRAVPPDPSLGGGPVARPWCDLTWAEMPKWQRLCSYLELHGPTTTGVLGHQKGIGENVRGIRREACANLRGRASSIRVVSIPTGKPWRLYRLVDARTIRLEPDRMELKSIIAEAKDLDEEWRDAIARDDFREEQLKPHIDRSTEDLSRRREAVRGGGGEQSHPECPSPGPDTDSETARRAVPRAHDGVRLGIPEGRLFP